jgi:proteasome lid subunit RPN8/RPN11
VGKVLEEKIRELCLLFPNLEWSGVLYYKIIGDLEFEGVDLYPLDVGTSGSTSFIHVAELDAYTCSSEGLLDCCQGLVHSHNSMSTFFSGTDVDTLREMVQTHNNYLSLIVNNAGVYNARLASACDHVDTGVETFTCKDFAGKPVTIKRPRDGKVERCCMVRECAVIHRPRSSALGKAFENAIKNLQKSGERLQNGKIYKEMIEPWEEAYDGYYR